MMIGMVESPAAVVLGYFLEALHLSKTSFIDPNMPFKIKKTFTRTLKITVDIKTHPIYSLI